MAGMLVKPCFWANEGSPTILFIVCIRCSVGAGRSVHPAELGLQCSLDSVLSSTSV